MATGVSFKSDDEIESEEDKELEGFVKPGSGQGFNGMTRLETLLKVRSSISPNARGKFAADVYKQLNEEIEKIYGA